MKSSKIAVAIATGLAAATAVAGPSALPAGPLYLQYNNAEQVSFSNSIPIPGGGGATEGNWGIVQITSLVRGTALAPSGSDIQGGGTPVFFDQVLPAGAQILGIFYGAQFIGTGAARQGDATGQSMDLYWWDGSSQNIGAELASAANLAKHTGQNEYTGFTCAAGNTASCTFLAHFDFGSGAEPGAPGVTVTSPTIPGTADGTSKSYMSVDVGYTNGLGQLGAWAAALDTNFFTLDPCNNPVGHVYAGAAEICPTTGLPIGTGALNPGALGGVSYAFAADVRLDNNFSRNGATAWDVPGTDILGLRSNDPARTDAIPEPGSLALVGLAVAALGAFTRCSRRRDNA